ncbi:MAG: hypothetical protein CMH28_03800 [Micavibrio sp.]|nr:hypothetical protein [Micavibrio sp.]
MKQWLENMTGSFSPSAKIVEGTLVLSLPNAVSPVVWRMDLGKTKSSAIEVREDENLFSLVLKTPQADIYKIARYESKLPATQALMCIMDAMSKAQGQLHATSEMPSGNRLPAVVPQASEQKGFDLIDIAIGVLKYAIMIILAIIVIYIGFRSFFFITSLSEPRQVAVTEGSATQQQPSVNTAPVGEAVSADEFLN